MLFSGLARILGGISLCAIFAVAGCAVIHHPGLKQAKQEQRALFIGSLDFTVPNKRGRVGVNIQFFNTSYKTYKYVEFGIEAYNRVGDPIRRPNDQTSIVELRFTGPLPPRRTPGVVEWRPVWTASTIVCLALRHVRLIDMENSEVTVTGQALQPLLSKRAQRPCGPV